MKNLGNFGMSRLVAEVLCLPLLLLACSIQGVSSADSTTPNLIDLVTPYLQQTVSATQLKSLSEFRVAQYYLALLQGTTDDSLQVGQNTLGNARSALIGAAPIFLSLDQEFASMGELLKAADSSGSRATQAEVLADLAPLASAYQTRSGVLTAASKADLAAAERSNSAVALGQSSEALRNFGALELVASLTGSTSLGLAGVSPLPITCGLAGKTTLYYVPSFRRYGHVGVGVELTNPALKTTESTLISYADGPTTVPQMEATYGPVEETIDLPPMTDEQVANFQNWKATSPDYAQAMQGVGYNAAKNNCADMSLKTLLAIGYPIEMPASRVTKPGDVRDAVVRYNASNSNASGQNY